MARVQTGGKVAALVLGNHQRRVYLKGPPLRGGGMNGYVRVATTRSGFGMQRSVSTFLSIQILGPDQMSELGPEFPSGRVT